MNRFKKIVRKLVADQEGAALVEYGLLVALIAIAAIVGITAIGDNVLTLFNAVAGYLTI